MALGTKEGARQFNEAFLSSYLQGQKLRQEETQFNQEMGFRDRQLQLNEAFRRDDLTETIKYHNTLNNYYNEQIRQGDESAGIRINESRQKMFIEGWQPTTEQTPYKVGDTYWNPPAQPDKHSTFGNIGGGFFGETQYENNTVVGYDNVRQSPFIDNGGGGDNSANISSEVGEANKILEVFKEYDRRGLSDTDKIEITGKDGKVVEWDKGLLRAEGKKYVTDMLNKVGIDVESSYLNNIRDAAGVPTYGKNQLASFSAEERNKISRNKEKALLDEIDTRKAKGEISEQQWLALRYWAKIGSK